MDNLAGAMNRMNVTWACLTSTVANLITPAEVPGLKTLVLSGEAPTQTNLNTWGGKVHLINAYGPSECSIWCSYMDGLQIGTSPTNIGRGLGSRLWIAEDGNDQRLAPLGCVGELLIEGPIMARGYLDAPEKTAAVFIESPKWLQRFGPMLYGSRMYKTGDSARYNTDGTIEYLGRRDAQTKINGQRIEMGEIEFHLKRQFSTAQSIAVDVVAPAKQKTLAAFFCLETKIEKLLTGSDILLQLSDATQSELTDLQTSLLSSLPKHMVPTLFVPLSTMPTTASGKLDRKALRVILNNVSKDQLQRYALANVAKRAPSTAEEKALARLWAQALGVSDDSVGVNDNFFQLGGDSIVAMRLVGLARAEGMGLNVSNIFRYPRLAEAAALLANNSDDITQTAPALKPFAQLDVPNVDAFLENFVCPKAHVEKENIENVLDATDFQSLAITGGLTETRWMLNYFYFESSGSLDLERMRKACAEVVQRFDILRTVFILHKAKFLQVILKTLVPKFRFSKTDQDLDTFTKLIYKSGLSSYLPLEEPMVQFYVVKHKHSPRHRVIMRISHAQYDGVSLPIIWEYFKSAYEGQAGGQPTTFTSYVSHSKLRQTEESYQYWRSLLAGSSMTDIVAHDKPNVRKATDVPEVLTRSIRVKSLQSEGITFATVIKAAWALVLSQLAGRSDVVFGHTISGRNLDLDEVEKVVGACINVVPVRAILKPGWKVIDLLQFVQDQQLANVPHETLGTREIIRRCTDWPQYNYFSTIVQHQNIDPDESIMLGNNEYTPGFIGSDLDLVDLGILSTPMGEKVEISLTYSSTTISPVFAKGLLTLLCTTVRSFSASPFESLPPLQSRQPLIPISRTGSSIAPTMSSTDSFKEIRVMTEKEQMRLQAMLESAWTQVLHYDDKAAQEMEITNNVSFFDLGGDMVQVAQLACVLAEKGFRVKLEDLVDYDTIDEQVELLAPLLT
jgi:aryl carrier-like protein